MSAASLPRQVRPTVQARVSCRVGPACRYRLRVSCGSVWACGAKAVKARDRAVKARCRTGARGMALRPQTKAAKMCASVTLPVLLLLVPRGLLVGRISACHGGGRRGGCPCRCWRSVCCVKGLLLLGGERGIEGLGAASPTVGLGHALAAQGAHAVDALGRGQRGHFLALVAQGCIRGCMAWVKVVHALSCAGPVSAGP